MGMIRFRCRAPILFRRSRASRSIGRRLCSGNTKAIAPRLAAQSLQRQAGVLKLYAIILLMTIAPQLRADHIGTRIDGYRGIWYMNQPQNDQFKFKYSGGFATYPQQHVPMAVYVPQAEKTFFVFGGKTGTENR